PAGHHPIKLFHHRLRIHPNRIPSGLRADRATDALHSLLRWHRAQVDPVPFHRVASPERNTQESQTSLPASSRFASSSHSPSASASTSSPASPPELAAAPTRQQITR